MGSEIMIHEHERNEPTVVPGVHRNLYHDWGCFFISVRSITFVSNVSLSIMGASSHSLTSSTLRTNTFALPAVKASENSTSGSTCFALWLSSCVPSEKLFAIWFCNDVERSNWVRFPSRSARSASRTVAAVIISKSRVVSVRSFRMTEWLVSGRPENVCRATGAEIFFKKFFFTYFEFLIYVKNSWKIIRMTINFRFKLTYFARPPFAVSNETLWTTKNSHSMRSRRPIGKRSRWLVRWSSDRQPEWKWVKWVRRLESLEAVFLTDQYQLPKILNRG